MGIVVSAQILFLVHPPTFMKTILQVEGPKMSDDLFEEILEAFKIRKKNNNKLINKNNKKFKK